MNNKRFLLIAAVALLVIIAGVAVFLAYPRPVESAHVIPVTGLSGSENSLPFQFSRQQMQYFRPLTNKWESCVEQVIQVRPSPARVVIGLDKWAPLEQYRQPVRYCPIQ